MASPCASGGPGPEPTQALLGLGGNLGDRAATLGRALARLAALPSTRLLAVSPAYDSDPVGPAGQPTYLNLCAAVETRLGPRALLEAGLGIERDLGRVRGAPNGPRTCDIDLLFHGAAPRLDEPGLVLPHPRWRERAFVVIPLGELLQLGALAKAARWDGLRAEIAALGAPPGGLRPWNGPTPWAMSPT
jgi:2-amino-4-hydroxy-6-hydroxymethyldihydropteridine diphosphokinase